MLIEMFTKIFFNSIHRENHSYGQCFLKKKSLEIHWGIVTCGISTGQNDRAKLDVLKYRKVSKNVHENTYFNTSIVCNQVSRISNDFLGDRGGRVNLYEQGGEGKGTTFRNDGDQTCKNGRRPFSYSF